MENNVLLSTDQALASDQLLKLSALLYLKEALIAQKYETCQELIDTARNLGIDQGDISAVITDFLKEKSPDRQRRNRVRQL